MRKAHLISLVAAALAMVMSLTACSGTSSSGSKAAAASGSGSGSSTAAKWPGSDVTVYVAASAGSNTDLTTRVMTAWMQKKTGKTFTVINQTDGGGVQAYETVRNTGKNGLTVFVNHSGVDAQYWLGQYKYKPDENFKIMGSVAKTGNQAYITSTKNTNYSNLTELVNYAKANPGKVRWGVKLGNATHLSTVQMELLGDFDVQLMDAGDQNTKLTGVIGQTLDIGNVSLDVAEQYVKSGDCKILFTSMPYKDCENLQEWNGGKMAVIAGGHIMVWCNKDVDEAFLTAADACFKEYAADAEVQKQLTNLGVIADFADHTALLKEIKDDVTAKGEAATAAGLNKQS